MHIENWPTCCILWWPGQVNSEEGDNEEVDSRRNSKPNQNQDGAAMHTVAAVKASIAIN